MPTLQQVFDVSERPRWIKSEESFEACCPAHDDKNPSLFVQLWRGQVTVRCRADCPTAEVIQAFKLKGVDIDSGYDESYTPFHPLGIDYPSFRPPFAVENSYVYHDGEGFILGARFRGKDPDGKKTFMTVTPHRDVTGKIVLRPTGFPHPAPLYGLNLLVNEPDRPVLIVEGEKAADNARTLEACQGYVIVSWPDGVSGVRKTDWSPLTGRNILIWPDNDSPGKGAWENIRRILNEGIALSVAVIDIPHGLPKKFDLGDPIPDGLDVANILHAALPENSSLSSHILSTFEISRMDIPEREDIVKPFLKTSSINMLYATRGIGKTWFCLILADCIARGTSFLGFEATGRRGVLYIDGEMPSGDLKERLAAISAFDAGPFWLLPSEPFHKSGNSLNIQDVTTQNRITDMLEERKLAGAKVDLVILDNLSSLSAGTDENDNGVLDQLLKWLVKLRHMGYAVLMVHHAGKSGDQRGASRREDLMDVVIKLGPVAKEDGTFQDGKTQFRMEFPKHRHKRDGPDALDVTLEPNADGKLTFSYGMPIDHKKLYDTLRYIAANEHETQVAIAKGMGCSTGKVSVHLKQLRKDGFLSAADFVITPRGWSLLKSLFPEYKDIATESSLP